MTSNPDEHEPLGDLALISADVDAMRRSASSSIALTTDEYLRFLDTASANVAPSRKTSEGWVPFDLQNTALSPR
jgi:hypothetical protein